MSSAQDVPGKRLGFLPAWTAVTYAAVVFNLLMFVWVVSGAGVASYLAVLWVTGDVVLGLLWVLDRRGTTGHTARLPPSATQQPHPRNDSLGGGGGGGGSY